MSGVNGDPSASSADEGRSSNPVEDPLPQLLRNKARRNRAIRFALVVGGLFVGGALVLLSLWLLDHLRAQSVLENLTGD
jgi:hypothetical protein